MTLPPADIGYLSEAFEEASRDVEEAFRLQGPPDTGQATPMLLAEAMRQLFEVLKRIESDQYAAGVPRPASTPSDPGAYGTAPATPAQQALSQADISELGDYGLSLIGDLVQWAAQLGREHDRRRLEGLAFPLALWVARKEGELRTLEPVVNALAAFANGTTDPATLDALGRAIMEIIDAVSPFLREDLEKSNPGRPWRILILNYGIIATRSHNTALMETAFQTLTRHLPEEAPEFFRTGMEQMELLNYPGHVREVVEKYHRQWRTQHTLH